MTIGYVHTENRLRILLMGLQDLSSLIIKYPTCVPGCLGPYNTIQRNAINTLCRKRIGDA